MERYRVSLGSTRLTHSSEGAEGGRLTLPVPAAAGARAACVLLTCAVPAAPPAEHGATKTASPGPEGMDRHSAGRNKHRSLTLAGLFLFKQNSPLLVEETEF